VTRRLLPLLLLLAASLLGPALPARADDAAAAATALRSSPVYQAPGLDLVDVATLDQELAGRDPRVVLAVLPASAAGSDDEARSRAVAIGQLLADPGAVVLVVTADEHVGVAQGHAVAARHVDAGAALRAELTAQGTRAHTRDGLAALVVSFTERVVNQAATGGTAGVPRRSSSYGGWLLWSLLPAVGGTLLVVRARGRQRAVGGEA
jgi:hypothetical protein